MLDPIIYFLSRYITTHKLIVLYILKTIIEYSNLVFLMQNIIKQVFLYFSFQFI